MNQLLTWLDGNKAYAITIARVLTGVILIIAGYHKLFVVGIPGIMDGFAARHLFAAPLLGFLVPLLEFFGGIGILLGLFSRLFSFWVIVQFFLIAVYVKPVLFGVGWGGAGFRIDVVMVVFGILIITNGPGPLSLGRKLFKNLRWAE